MNLLFFDIQPENRPTLRFEFIRDRIAVGTRALVRLTVMAQPRTIYRNMQIVLIMPAKIGKALMSVCQVSVEVGSGLPCVDGDEIMKSVQLTTVR